MDAFISMFPRADDHKTITDVKLSSVLSAIKDGRWKDTVKKLRGMKKSDYDEHKIYLPCVTFSGTFSVRNAKSLKQYSGFIVIDIDKIDNLSELKEQLKEDPIIYSIFTSPSNKGIKVLIKIDTPSEMHKDLFASLERYFLDNYKVVVDTTGKDICRLCFVSYDKDLHLNENSDTYKYVPVPVIPKVIDEKYNFRPIGGKEQEVCTDTNYLYEKAVIFNRRKFVYVEGMRNAYMHALGCVLNKMGVNVGEAEMMAIQNCPAPQIGNEEIKAAIHSAYNNRHEHGVLKVYWDKPVPVVVKEVSPAKDKTKNNKEEEKLQFGICRHLIENYPGTIFYSESSGLKASIGVAMKLKAQRSEAGLPDLTIMKANGGYFGLAIELKCESNSPYLKDGVTLRGTGHIQEQAAVLARLREEGYKAQFATGWLEIKNTVDEYMKLPPTKIIIT